MNKLKQNDPRNGAASVNWCTSNFITGISTNICDICNKLEQDQIYETYNT